MSDQFSKFLVDNLINWLENEIKSGYRYRFYSDDPDNILSINEILEDKKNSNIIYGDTSLPYISIKDSKLIYVNDVETIMNENYISNLRDAVSAQKGIFLNSTLLVLHKSRLDTVLNSAKDLSSVWAPFHPDSVKGDMYKLISTSSLPTVFEELMNIQTKIIKDEYQSAFGYRNLYNSIITNKINFKELGLLNDSDLEKESDPDKIRKRLDKNKALHDEIETTIINFSTEIEDRLNKKYSNDFIQKNITYDNWEDVKYGDLIKEINKNKGSSISFENIDVKDGTLIPREESTTTVGKRTKNIIIFSNEQIVSLFFKFKGGGLKTNQFKILNNNNIKKTSRMTYMGVSRTLEMNIPYDQKPQYFKLRLDGEKASEKYNFKILILKESSFFLNNIHNHFIIQPNKKRILLQLNEFRINFSENESDEYILQNEETIDINQKPNINVQELYNTQDEVSFKITNGIDELNFAIEGKKIEQVISIPLLYNKDRLGKIFHNGINAELNHNAMKGILDNREFPLIGKRFTYIDLEYKMINDISSIEEIKEANESIYESYKNLLTYFQKNNTVPSLCAWDDEVCKLVSNFVSLFQKYMSSISINKSLNKNQKLIFNIGRIVIEGKDYLSPLSPLILSYILYLRKVSNDESFKDIAEVTLDRLNPKGLFPYLYKGSDTYAYTRLVNDDPLWLEFVPNEDSEYSYVSKLTTEKIVEFTKAFEKLFEFRHDAPLIINSINNGTNKEFFKGLTDYYKNTYEDKPKKIIVNLYDKNFQETEFDIFADLDLYEDLQNRYKLNLNAETIIDVMRTHITYSKHTLNDPQEYSHLSFFKNNEKVEIIPNKVNLQKSGLVCNGLVSGESAEKIDDYYYSGFGLRDVNIENKQHLQIAKLYNALQRSVCEDGILYDEDETISLMISGKFKERLEESYQNTIWTVIIDPKVTLDFFYNDQDLILIHYSDQYSSSANYDAITVTAQKELYENVVGNENIIREFNSFNGKWLIQMIAEKQERNKREKRGVIAAYKYITSFVDIPDITWVPLSVAEIVRVSGNIGLSMSQSDFSRYNSNLTDDEKDKHIGPISDDILLVGFCSDGIVLYPVEVKSGSADMRKANEQSKALRSFLYDFLFKDDSFKSTLLKGLFIRQVFMQIDKFELYNVFDKKYFNTLHNQREELLKGDFTLVELQDFSKGAVVFFNDSSTQFNSDFNIVDDILECRLPSSYQQQILETSYQDLKVKIRNGVFGTDTSFMLNNVICTKLTLSEKTEVDATESIEKKTITLEEESNPEKEQTNTIQVPKKPMQIKFGTDDKTKKEILWFPTNSSKTLNTNTAIIGTMGTGKTQFTKSVITQIIRNSGDNIDSLPIDILIFNYKAKDYLDDKFITETKGKVYEPYHLPFNPLSLFGSRPLLPVHTSNLFKTTLSKSFGLGQVQQSNLNRIIMEAYEQKGIIKNDSSTWSKPAPTIQDLWEIYSNEEKVVYDSLYSALEKLSSFEIFEPNAENTTSLFDMLDGITVINIAGYDPDIQNLIVAITLDIFYTQMQVKGASVQLNAHRQMTKMLLVDEADNFMSQDFESLKKILKEGREFGVGTILSTQQISHFKTSENDYTEYILSWIIHKVDKIKSQDVNSIFNISNKIEVENLMDQIRQLPEHYSIYVDGKKNMLKMRDLAFWELSNG